jgi:KDO2-lipid IV(A) lauroyltransferase
MYRLAAFLSRLPPERMAYWIGLRIADAFYRRNRAGREAVMSNLKNIYTARGVEPATDALQGLARKCYQYFGKYLIDFFRYARVTPEEVRRRVSIEHGEYLQECLALGRGAVLVTAHFGNWELGAAVMAAMGYKINAMVLPERLQKLNRMFQRQRESRGVKLIPVGRSAVLNAVHLLKQGELVGLLGDRDFTGKNDRVDFFGRPARIPRGPAWLSFKTNAPILLVFLIRQVDDSFLMRFYPPILPEKEGSVEALRSRICRIMEQEIGERPYQWFIFDDFWANAGATAPGIRREEK